MAFLLWAIRAIAVSALSMYAIESFLQYLDWSNPAKSWKDAISSNVVLAACYALTFGIEATTAGRPPTLIPLAIVFCGCLLGAVIQYYSPIGGRDAA